MNDQKMQEIKKWYQLLGVANAEERAKGEVESGSNHHSFELFLRGAWLAVMSAVEDDEVQHEALFAMCYYLSDQSSLFRALGSDDSLHKQWGVFEIGPDGKPGERLDGLHYYMEDCRPNE